MRDFMNNIHLVQAIAPLAAQTNADTAITSAIIDTLGYDGLTFGINIGTNTDANVTFAVSFEHGDNSALSDTAVPAATDLVGTTTLAGFTYGDDGECRKIGYIGNKRYVRMTITPSGNNSGDIFVDAIAILGYPHVAPTANPPQ